MANAVIPRSRPRSLAIVATVFAAGGRGVRLVVDEPERAGGQWQRAVGRSGVGGARRQPGRIVGLHGPGGLDRILDLGRPRRDRRARPSSSSRSRP